MNKIKIYQFDCDYIAAKNFKDAIREWISNFDGTIHEGQKIGRLLSNEELVRLTFIDDVYNPGKSNIRSFQEELNRAITRGEKFPMVFATSEF